MNNSNFQVQHISKSRKFHDAWAFILFAISCIGFTSYSILTINSQSFSTISLSNDLVIKNGIFCFSIVLVFILINFIGLRFFPEIFLKTTSCLYPLGLFIFAKMLDFSPIVIISSIISLLVWALLLYSFWKYLGSVGKIMKVVMKVFNSNLFTIVFGLILVFSLQAFQIILFASLNYDFGKSGTALSEHLFQFFFLLNFFWTFFNSNYFFQVYNTSVMAFNLYEFSDTSFLTSLKNTLYSLGSICLGGLLVAIVTTLRFFVDRARNDNDRRNENRNLITSILLCIVTILLSMLESFLQFQNSLTFPYIAIHGKKYSESVKESFDFIERESPVGIAGIAALQMSLSIFSILIVFLCFGSWQSFAKLTSDEIIKTSILLTSILPVFFYFVTMLILSSGYIGMIYISSDALDAIDDKYSKDLREAFLEK